MRLLLYLLGWLCRESMMERRSCSESHVCSTMSVEMDENTTKFQLIHSLELIHPRVDSSRGISKAVTNLGPGFWVGQVLPAFLVSLDKYHAEDKDLSSHLVDELGFLCSRCSLINVHRQVARDQVTKLLVSGAVVLALAPATHNVVIDDGAFNMDWHGS